MNETNVTNDGYVATSDPYTFNFHQAAMSVVHVAPWVFRAEGFLLGVTVTMVFVYLRRKRKPQ